MGPRSERENSRHAPHGLQRSNNMSLADKKPLDVDRDFKRLMIDFYNREIDRFSVYLEGFGGISVSRTKDGMVAFYTDKNKKLGNEDHVTALFSKGGLISLHRKVSDKETDAFMRLDAGYFESYSGIEKLVQDMQKQTNMPLIAKLLYIPLYTIVIRFFEAKSVSVRVLNDSEAEKLRMKSPCAYIKPAPVERLLLLIIGRNILLQNLVYLSRFGKKPTDAFREVRVLGTTVTKHPRKRNKS